MSAETPIAIRRVADASERAECARIMCTSEPWLTLGRDYEASLHSVCDESREVYVTTDDSGVCGFIIINMNGPFAGYIQSVAVRADYRGRGLGRLLIRFAEERIFNDSPNVFLCVSSFNTRARTLYERLGYEQIGELRDYIVAGHSEYLLRKTLGPRSTFGRG